MNTEPAATHLPIPADERTGPVRFGCIADDYTGATDVASGLRRTGQRTVLLFGQPTDDTDLPPCDVLVIGLKTRNLAPLDAVSASLAAQKWLAERGIEQTYFKYCSTFDSTDEGNIGPVSDALLDLAGAPLTVICPTAPEHGRTVYQGNLFVWDQLLSESSMRYHPLTPMTDANLVRVLSRQTPHRVSLVGHQVVRQGAAAIRAALDELIERGVRYAVVDAVDDDDLLAVAAASSHLPVVTGSAGLARAIGEELHQAGDSEGLRHGLPDGPTVVLAGSCSARTLEQVELARGQYRSLRLDPQSVTTATELASAATSWIDENLADQPLMLYSSAPAERRSADAGDGSSAAALLEHSMGLIARHLVNAGVHRLVIAGGETSGAVVEALGVTGVTVAWEEDRGVPWTITDANPPLALLLKSGNFGQPDLFLRAAKAT